MTLTIGGLTEKRAETLFLFGGCLSFAVALQKVIGGSIYCLAKDGKMLHAFVKNSSGSYDVKGKRGTLSMAKGISGAADGWAVGGPFSPSEIPFKYSRSLEAKAAEYISDHPELFL